MLFNPHIIAINNTLILWKTIRTGSWFKLQRSWCSQTCGSNPGLGTIYPESLCGFPQSAHAIVRTVQVALILHSFVLHLLALMPLANLHHFLIYALSILVQHPLAGYEPGCCHTCMNKTGRLYTHCKLHVTMHSPFTSDHGHKFKPRGLLVCLFLCLPSFPSFMPTHITMTHQIKEKRMKQWPIVTAIILMVVLSTTCG